MKPQSSDQNCPHPITTFWLSMMQPDNAVLAQYDATNHYPRNSDLLSVSGLGAYLGIPISGGRGWVTFPKKKQVTFLNSFKGSSPWAGKNGRKKRPEK